MFIAATASACSVKYKCELGEECLGVKDAYSAAIENGGNSETTMPAPKNKRELAKMKKRGVYTSSASSRYGVQKGEFEPYSGNKLLDKPVYQPPTPIRIWIAPWRLNDGQQEYLLSGQYLYVQRPGRWTMGTLRNPGFGSVGLDFSPRQLPDENAKDGVVQPKDRLVDDRRR